MDSSLRTASPTKTVVTGGAGFIGSHLCDRLVAIGRTVLCVDNYSTGARANVLHLIANPRFELMEHDVTFPLHVDASAIYNLASAASPIHYQRNPVQTTRTIVLGAMNMLAIAEQLRVPILQASTSEVYGDPAEHPQRESYWGHVNPIGARSCYDEGKRCAETLFFDYYRHHHVQIKVARIFNTYGPRMQTSDGRVISNFIVQALRNATITLYGDGSQTRSFCYVSDLVEAFLRLMQTPPAFAGPVNIGNDEEISMAELAHLVIDITGSRSRIDHVPLPADDPRRRRPDITMAQTVLGWRPSVSLREGLGHTVAYFDSLLSQTRSEQVEVSSNVSAQYDACGCVANP